MIYATEKVDTRQRESETLLDTGAMSPASLLAPFGPNRRDVSLPCLRLATCRYSDGKPVGLRPRNPFSSAGWKTCAPFSSLISKQYQPSGFQESLIVTYPRRHRLTIACLRLSRSLARVCGLVIKSKQQPVHIGRQISYADLILRKHDLASSCQHGYGIGDIRPLVGVVSLLLFTFSQFFTKEDCVCPIVSTIFSPWLRCMKIGVLWIFLVPLASWISLFGCLTNATMSDLCQA